MAPVESVRPDVQHERPHCADGHVVICTRRHSSVDETRSANDSRDMMFRRELRLVLPLGIVAASLVAPRAQAELTDAVYDDVKTVIQDLMVEEVAHTAVPNSVCQAPVLLRYYPSSMQRLYDRQLGALKGGLQEETASLLGSFVYYSITEQSLDLRQFLAKQAPKLNSTDCATDVKAANGPYYFARSQVSIGRPLLEDKCHGNATVDDKLVPCEFALAVRDFALGQKGPAEDHLRRILAYLLGQIHGLNSAPQLEELNGLLAVYLKDPLLKEIPWVDDTAVKDLLAAANSRLLADVRIIVREWQILTQSGKAALAPRAMTELMLREALPQFNTACKKSKACLALLGLVRNENARDLLAAADRGDARAVAVEALRAAFSVLKTKKDCNDILTPFKREEAVTSFSLKDQFAAEGAVAGPPGADAAQKNEPDCQQQETISRYGRFAATLASYVMASEDGAVTESMREAFRSAAFELLRTEGPKTGFDRTFVSAIFFPTPSLRFSWSPGYINESTTNGFRYLAVLDWLTIQARLRYTQAIHVGATLSLVDLLGPLSENAFRQQSPAPNEAGRVWNNFINPKLELGVGFPGLSTHLALTAGVSWRATAAFRDRGEGDEFTYYSWLDQTRPTDYDNKPFAFYSQFIESGIGIKYVP